MNMTYRRLGRTGLEVSRLALGANRFHTLDLEARRKLIASFVDHGINLIDTAQQYGAGQSEAALGEVLDGRTDVHIVTKYRLRVDDGKLQLDPADIEKALDESLKRLGREYVDVYHLHGLLPEHLDQAVDGFGDALQRIKASGKARFIGVTENCQRDPDHEMLEKAIPTGLFDAVLVKYSLINPSAEEAVFPLALKHDVGVMVMVPVQCHSVGYLGHAETWNTISPEWRSAAAAGAQTPIDFLHQEGPYATIAEGAAAYAAEPEAVASVVSGMRSVHHMLDNLRGVVSGPVPGDVRRRLAPFATVDRDHLVRKGNVA